MSYLSELDSTGWEQRNAEEQLNQAAPAEDGPGFFKGVIKGPATGLMRGFANLNDLLLTATDLVVPMSDEERGQQDELRRSAADFWTPDARTIGTAGRVLGGAAEGLAPLAVPLLGPALTVGSNTLAAGKRAVDAGVDAKTAGEIAAVEGAATAVGLKLPILGSTLGQRLATGAAGNLALGAGSTEAEHALLNRRGYEEMAKNYDPLDGEARAVDLISGLVFGGLHHAMLPSERAAAAALNNAKHFQKDTAPGVPVDADASVKHQRAMESSTDSLATGNPVNVGADVTRANFKPRLGAGNPIPDDLRALDADLATSPASEIPRATKLSDGDRAIEGRFAKRVETDVDAAAAEYAKLEDSAGGKILNTDVARELSPDYLKDRTKSAAVHEPASWLIKKLYATKLAEAPRAGEEPLVLFSAGGTGAGKTSGLDLVPELVTSAQIVYDTNMNKFEGARQKIDQALAAGKDVHVVYTYRDPIEALKNGALPRAARQEKKFGSGRTVPLEEHLGTHVGSRQTMDQLAAHYAADDRVVITAIDNSRGKNGARAVELGEIPKLPKDAYNGLREKAVSTLEAELGAGRISEAVHRGFSEGVPDAAGKGNDRGNRQESQSPVDGERVDDPVTAAVRTALAAEDLQLPTGEIGADGNAVTRSARELMVEADAEVAGAQETGKGITAAVSCFLTRGG